MWHGVERLKRKLVEGKEQDGEQKIERPRYFGRRQRIGKEKKIIWLHNANLMVDSTNVTLLHFCYLPPSLLPTESLITSLIYDLRCSSTFCFVLRGLFFYLLQRVSEVPSLTKPFPLCLVPPLSRIYLSASLCAIGNMD